MPPRGGAGQLAEEEVGPYELQDFNLYYLSRFGFLPSRIAYLAYNAWSDCNRGNWPDLLPPEKRHQYDLATIRKWLEVFLVRFFATSQFKRSALPTRQRWAQAARCRHAAIGAPQATQRPTSGSKS